MSAPVDSCLSLRFCLKQSLHHHKIRYGVTAFFAQQEYAIMKISSFGSCLGLSVAVLLFLIFCVWGFSFTQDDAFISFRYARNMAYGNGLRFNPGQNPPVEGYTNFLWTVLMTLPFCLNIDPILFSKITGMIAGISLIWLTWVITRKITGSNGFALLAGFLLSLNVTFCLWSVSGMETTLFSSLILVIVFMMIHIRTPRVSGFVAAAGSLLCILTRPEGILIVIALVVVASVHNNFTKTRHSFLTSYILCFTLIFTIYAGWKWLYFGSLIPNTFYAKVSLNYAQRMESGYLYLKGWFLHWAWPLVILASVSPLQKKNRHVIFVLYIFTATMLSYILFVGGDFMHYHRFMVPVMGPLIILTAVSIQKFTDDCFSRITLIRKLLYVIIAMLCAFGYASSHLYAHYTHFKNFDPSDPLQETRHRDTILAYYLKKTFPENSTLAIFNIGRIPYYTNYKTIDTLGLTDPVIARCLRRSDMCGVGERILLMQPNIIVPQGQLLLVQETHDWKTFFLGEWKGNRTTSGISLILDPDHLDINQLEKCPHVVDAFHDCYERFVVQREGNTMVLYLDSNYAKIIDTEK
ncbi:glycosyltransferase family 39 protein [bacterium]|nr:glycosyltransferase family 39 protein [candidate division CSSED10-310 bacterium]